MLEAVAWAIYGLVMLSFAIIMVRKIRRDEAASKRRYQKYRIPIDPDLRESWRKDYR